MLTRMIIAVLIFFMMILLAHIRNDLEIIKHTLIKSQYTLPKK